MLGLNVIETGTTAHAVKVVQRDTTRHADWARLVTAIARQHARRNRLLRTIRQDLRQEDRLVLVVSDRKDLAEHIYDRLKDESSVWYLHGKLPMRERDTLWRSIGERRGRCLIATNITEHLNVGGSAGFNTLHLVTLCFPYDCMRRAKPLLLNYHPTRLPPDPDRPIIRYYLDAHPWLQATFRKSEKNAP